MSNIEKIYPYASGDRLSDDRNTYFYTKFHGVDTFSAWKKLRGKVTSVVGRDLSEIFDAEDKTPTHFKKILEDGNEIDTDILLNSLNDSLNKDVVHNDIIFWVDKLIKKFEVTKRIHKSYSSSRFLAVNKNLHRDLTLYFKLAYLLEKVYQKTHKLPSLNAFLKVMDSLNSQSCKFSKAEASYFNYLHNKEQIIMEELANKMGVDI